MKSTYYEDRVATLEAALEDLLDCFDTGGEDYSIEVIGDDQIVVAAYVTESTEDSLNHAIDVLYNEDDTEDIEC